VPLHHPRKEKEKEKEKKIPIKSENKRKEKEKLFMSKASHNRCHVLAYECLFQFVSYYYQVSQGYGTQSQKSLDCDRRLQYS